MKTISLTIPLKEGPLRRAADMLKALAEDAAPKDVGTSGHKCAKVVKGMAMGPTLTAEEMSADVVETVVTSAGVAASDTMTAAEIAEGDAGIAADAEAVATKEEPQVTNATEIFGAPAAPIDPRGAILDTPEAPVAPGVELDGEGLPWDGRIHTDAKTKIKAGTWKLKRGVDATLVEQVKAELTGVMSAPAVTTAVPPAPAAEGDVTTFPQLVEYVTEKCNAGVVLGTQIAELLAKHGIDGGLPLVASRPDLIPAIYADMVALWPTG